MAGAERRDRRFGKAPRKPSPRSSGAPASPPNGRLTTEALERLEREALRARFSTRTQVAGLHKLLIGASRVAKLDAWIDPAEIRGREIGATSETALRAFPRKYGLDATAERLACREGQSEPAMKHSPLPRRKLRMREAIPDPGLPGVVSRRRNRPRSFASGHGRHSDEVQPIST